MTLSQTQQDIIETALNNDANRLWKLHEKHRNNGHGESAARVRKRWTIVMDTIAAFDREVNQ